MTITSRLSVLLPVLAATCLPCLPAAAEEEAWERPLKLGIASKFSHTRHNALKQVDSNSVKGLKAIWSILEVRGRREPLKIDWYVREGAFDALSRVSTPEAEAEITRVLEASRHEASKEAIVFSIVWKIRKAFVKEFGGNDEERIAQAKYLLRKTRGVDYFDLILPIVKKIDPDRKRFGWIKTAFQDKSARVRIAALQAMMSYPDNSSIPVLIANLKELEKKRRRAYREWVFTRYALETLTGQYFRNEVSDWERWWGIVKDRFDLAKRVEEEKGKEKEGTTRVVKRQGLELTVNMKIAGRGYPMLVLPWRGFEPDYFRPYFHGIEEFLKTFYVQLPSIGDFKGLSFERKSGTTRYPTALLAGALADVMKEEILQGGRKIDQFAIMGHGPGACTLAAMMAGKFPKQVSHLVLVSPMSSGGVYGTAIQNVERYGRAQDNWEIQMGTKMIRHKQDGKPMYIPADGMEAGGLSRALSNVRYADPTSPEIGAIHYLYQVPGGTSVMNDDSWSIARIFGNKKPRLPVMIVKGEQNPWTPVGDMNRVEAAFRRPYVARFRKAGETPFIFETYAFTAHMRRFFGSTGVKSARSREKW